MLTHAIMLMALVLFFALKYRQAKRKFNTIWFVVCMFCPGLLKVTSSRFQVTGLSLLAELLPHATCYCYKFQVSRYRASIAGSTTTPCNLLLLQVPGFTLQGFYCWQYYYPMQPVIVTSSRFHVTGLSSPAVLLAPWNLQPVTWNLRYCLSLSSLLIFLNNSSILNT